MVYQGGFVGYTVCGPWVPTELKTNATMENNDNITRGQR